MLIGACKPVLCPIWDSRSLAAAAECYYHFLAFSANDLDILMMISAHRVSYFVAVPLCGMWSMAGSFFLFTAMTMKVRQLRHDLDPFST